MHRHVIDDLIAGRAAWAESTRTSMLWPKLFPYRQRPLVGGSCLPVVQIAARQCSTLPATLDPPTAGSNESRKSAGNVE